MKKNDKGLITWIFTLINLIIGGSVALGLIGAAISTGTILTIVLSVIWVLLGIYFIWHSVMILLGTKSNTWFYVVVSFIISAIVGGILMLIAKIIN
ncbi:MAG: hypothetical protein HRS50_02485 [Mycoplasmataceae bacterium]|nr:hypothetical protein [Mycoplasmataceae bacterium]